VLDFAVRNQRSFLDRCASPHLLAKCLKTNGPRTALLFSHYETQYATQKAFAANSRNTEDCSALYQMGFALPLGCGNGEVSGCVLLHSSLCACSAYWRSA
jgi:hypothetical protein